MKTKRTFVAHPRHPLTGKQFQVSARTRRELEVLLDHLDGLRNRLRLGTIAESDVARMLFRLRKGQEFTLAQAARSYLDRSSISENTRRRVVGYLGSFYLGELAPLTLHELDAPRLSRWIEQLGRQFTAPTVGVIWRTLRGIVRHALERGMVDRCPWGSWRPTIKGRVLERAPREAARHAGELRGLLSAARLLGDSSVEPKIASAALLGLRQGELAGLSWADVDARAFQVTIARQAGGGPTKGRRVDIVAAVPELFEILDRWAIVLGAAGLYRQDGPIFPCPWRSGPGQPLPYLPRAEVLTRAELRRAVLKAGLPNPERWTPHSLRDTFVTLEAQGAGGDLQAVQSRSRHASIASLVRYLRARTREIAPPRMLLDEASTPALLPAKVNGSHAR